MLKRYLKNDIGMETVEWAILIALVIAGVIVIIQGIAGYSDPK